MTAPVALLLGASRGLGLALARQLGERGYRLVITARSADELETAAEDLSRRGFEVTAKVADVADATAVSAAVRQVEESVGPIEALFVVAGIIQVGPLASVRREDFEQAINVMLWGPINAALAVVPSMRARGRGRIGIISSVGGLVSAPHLLPYSTAKFGAVGFARGLRSELVGTGVTVSTVTPGLMRTGSHLRAKFLGRAGAEFAWFATAASLPVLSIDADRAAMIIVDGVLKGRSTVIVTPLAHVASRVAGLAPGLTAAVLALTQRLLPTASGGSAPPIDGFRARDQIRGRRRAVLDRLTTLNDRAAARFLQRPH